ncbi:MAG: ATP-binding cassette domain-containing protein [Bacteroidales bacterium]|nr:ATP-binding cassette domain-containing protein [Bacteroidales bacterium]
MSERILDALVHLFAVIASVRSTESLRERRDVVYDFLLHQLNKDLANYYIKLFDDYYRQSIEQGRKSNNQYKVISRVTSKVTRIAIEINRELSPYQKYIVLVELYEYLNTGEISYIEQGLANDAVADKFNINKEELALMQSFVFETMSVTDKVVFSGDENCMEIMEPKHVYWEDLVGELHFIYIPSISIFLFKYFGTGEIEMNGSLIRENKTYMMRAGTSLKNNVSAPIFFYDIMQHVVSQSVQEQITLECRNVVYNFNPKVVGLHKFSFESRSGQLVGIMGVSGSGKSTFGYVISGMAKPQEGNVYINNIDIYKDPEAVKGLIGYVSQDDILIEDLTVYDNLYFNARMSFDNLSMEAIKDSIDTTLHTLGLYEIKDIKVGSPLNKKISGGQRKRLNIAIELIREPAIMILDEPTSGLSSHDSQNIIELLKDLTFKGKLIFVVIHQPSSDIFKMFDKLLVLDTGGYLIYNGNPVESLTYFRYHLQMLNSREVECRRCGNVNVEQVLNMISMPIVDEYGNSTKDRKVTPEEWYEKLYWGALDSSYIADPEPLPQITFKTPNRIKQLFLYFARDIKSRSANLQYMLINIFEAPLLALLLSVLIRYYNISDYDGVYSYAANPNIPVYLIISVIVAFFIGLTVSAEEIIQDRQIIKREAFLNLSRFSYIMSKCLMTLILSAVQMLFFVLVGNSILGIENMWGEYWLVLFTTAVSANLIGLILSDSLDKTINIYIIIPFMIIPQLILSGVFVKFEKMNPDVSSVTSVPWYSNVITARWAFEALAVNQFVYNEYEKDFYQFHKTKSQATYYKDYWAPTLKVDLDKVNKAVSHGNDAEARRLLLLLKNELLDPNNKFGDLKQPREEMFSMALFGSATYSTLMDYIESVRKFNVQRFNRADLAEDKYRKSIPRDQLEELRTRYNNSSISDFVCSKSGAVVSDVIMEYDNRLWQKSEAVYQDTDKSFKAPLFTPYKVVGGEKIDTFMFDVLIMWLMNIILFFVLQAGVIGNLLRNGLGIRFFVKRGK